MDKSFINGLVDVAKKLAPAIVPGGGAAIVAGKALLDLIRKVRETSSEADQAKLQEGLNALEDRVNAHADRTIDSLGDGDKG